MGFHQVPCKFNFQLLNFKPVLILIVNGGIFLSIARFFIYEYLQVNLKFDWNFIYCDLQVHMQIHWNFIFCQGNSEKEEPKLGEFTIAPPN